MTSPAPNTASTESEAANLAPADAPGISSFTVPLTARTHCTAALVDEIWPLDDRWPKMTTTGQTFWRASSCAVVLPALVGALPYA